LVKEDEELLVRKKGSQKLKKTIKRSEEKAKK